MRDRRKTFRIDNPVIIVYEVVSANKMQRDAAGVKNGGFLPGGVFSTLFGMEAELKGRIARIKHQSNELANALDLLNNKLNALINLLPMLDDREEDIRGQPLRNTNVSASGISFANEEYLAPDTCLYMKLLLAPDYYYVAAYARVVGCEEITEPHDAYRYQVRVEFTLISEQHRELLVKYTMSRERALLRARRVAGEADDADMSVSDNENRG